LRGPEDVCLDLVDAPDLVFQASLHASRAYVEGYRRLYQRLTALGQPSTTWCSYLHNGPAYIPSCDFWCLVSKEIGQEIIRPSIVMEMAPLERTIFHLDGPQALQHLDTMLALPNLHAVHQRVEDMPPDARFDLVTSRAFATLADFVALTRERLTQGGVWVAMKAHLTGDERQGVPTGVDMFHVEPLSVPGLDAARCLVWMRPG